MGEENHKNKRYKQNPLEIHDGWIENLKAERRTMIQ
jgi:hypothetical protein